MTSKAFSELFALWALVAVSLTPQQRAFAQGQCINGVKESQVRLRRIFYPKDETQSLSLMSLVGLYQDPRKDHAQLWYALLQNGKILVLDRKDSKSRKVFADLSSKIIYEGEMGLLGFTFAPNALLKKPSATNEAQISTFYVNYIAPNPLRTVISQIQTESTGKSNETVLLEIPQPASNHKGGTLLFGPDNYLYISLGDGGASHDKFKNGQNLGSLLGKILRIDVSLRNKNMNYSIPADNPFAKHGRKKTRPEIYAWGLRNPWKMSFDRATGMLIAADVGQDRYEEVNVIRAGKNYGWPILEGFHCLTTPPCDAQPYEAPALEYAHSEGTSVIGGYVYRGPPTNTAEKNSTQAASLEGKYIFGDYGTGTIWAADLGEKNKFSVLARTSLSISAFAQGADGELLVLSLDGKIFSLESAASGQKSCERDP